MRLAAFTLGLLALSVALTGCQAPPKPTAPTATVLRLPDYDAFVDATLTALRHRDFSSERVDRPGGLIVTRRTTGGQWFEFWRSDVQGSYQVFESSLHTIGRVVTVSIEPTGPEAAVPDDAPPASPASAGAGIADALIQPGPAGAVAAQEAPSPPGSMPVDVSPPSRPAGRYRVTIQVDKSRLETPTRQVTLSSGALRIFSERMVTEEGVRAARSPHEQWLPLGRDGLLEADLLAELAGLHEAEPADEAPPGS
jgi:hypothetical protein